MVLSGQQYRAQVAKSREVPSKDGVHDFVPRLRIVNDTEVRTYASMRPLASRRRHGAFVRAPALRDATIAIVSTAGLRTDDSAPWEPRDESFRIVPHGARDLRLGIWSPNLDRSGWLADANVLFPADLLEGFARQRRIGAVARRHLSFLGALHGELAQLAGVWAPRAAKLLLADNVDVAVVVPACPACTGIAAIIADELENGGVATLMISLVRDHVQRARPPRALHCEFPFGRPLGRPRDPAFQSDVLMALLELLTHPQGPVLVDYPIRIHDGWDDECAVPIVLNDESATAESARLWTLAGDRRNDETVAFSQPWTRHDTVAALNGFMRIIDGTPWVAAGLPAHPTDCALNLRCLYELAALRASPEVARARTLSAWFYHRTRAGALVLAAQRVMCSQGSARDDWFYLAPYAFSLPLASASIH